MTAASCLALSILPLIFSCKLFSASSFSWRNGPPEMARPAASPLGHGKTGDLATGQGKSGPLPRLPPPRTESASEQLAQLRHMPNNRYPSFVGQLVQFLNEGGLGRPWPVVKRRGSAGLNASHS